MGKNNPVTRVVDNYLEKQKWTTYFSENERKELRKLCNCQRFDFEQQFSFWSRLLSHWDTRNLKAHRSVHSEILAILNIYLSALESHRGLDRTELLPLRWKLAETQVDLQQKSLLFWRFEHDQALDRLTQMTRENNRAQAEFYTLTELADFLAQHVDNRSDLIRYALDAFKGVMSATHVALFFDEEESPDHHFWKQCWKLPHHQTRTYYTGMPDAPITRIFPDTEVMLCQTLNLSGTKKALLAAASHNAYLFNGFHTWFTLAGVHLASALKNADLNTRLNDMAIRDGLLGIYNRRHLEKRLSEAFKLSKRYQRPLSLLMLDIDHFKKVNDQYGHLIGDEVLKAVSQEMNTRLRTTDILGRYGGEEFLIILQETDLKGAEKLAGNLLKRIQQLPMNSFAEGLTVTASIGISSYSEADTTVEALVSTADKHLYLSKHRGRNQYTSHTAE